MKLTKIIIKGYNRNLKIFKKYFKIYFYISFRLLSPSSMHNIPQGSSTFLLSEFLFSKMIFNKNLYKFISLPKKLSYIGFKRKLSNLLVIFFQLSGLLLLISSLKKITKITSSYCPFFFKYLFFVLSMQNKTIGRTVISIQNKTISRTVFFNFYYFVFFLIILNSLRFKK